MSTKELIWDDKYSVGVKEIDDQHKNLFVVINELFRSIDSGITEEVIKKIISIEEEISKIEQG